MLEDRLLSEQGSGNTMRLQRSMSTVDKMGRLDEAILLKHTAGCSPSDDFFVGDYDEEPFCADGEKEAKSKSFLPDFQSSAILAAAEDDSESKFLIDRKQHEQILSSTRELPIEPIVEEMAEDSHVAGNPNSAEDEAREKALEAVRALSGLFELPPTPGKDYSRSPVSVRDLWVDHTRSMQESRHHDSTDDQDGSSKGGNSSLSRRSIFGSWSSGKRAKGESSAPSWSGFGIFSLEDRTTPSEPSAPPPHEFKMLHKEDRANSLPSRLPRKSSMKRFPSMQSASSSTEGTAASAKTVKRTVSFGKLETREYSIALSDHPSCSFGPPISLGWDFRDKEAIELDHYEEQRAPRRSMHQMVLSYNVRRYLLLKRAGYSNDELEQAMHEVDRVKRQRLVTDLLLPASKIDETLEDVVGHLKRLFAGGA